MAEHNVKEIEIDWEVLTPMESALWGTTLALHSSDVDGGIEAADRALANLRLISEVRSRRRDLEDEAAESNIYVTHDEFVSWYTVSDRIRYCRDPAHKPPTPAQVEDAYKRYLNGLVCFY